MRKINGKIPGLLPPPPKTEIDGKITDLSTKSIPELMELRDRQLNLLNHTTFINKLADKGSKLRQFLNKILEELKLKQDAEDPSNLLNNLKINDIDKESIQNVEWEGTIKSKRDVCLDSDDDSDPEDVMHILSQTTKQEKVIKIVQDSPKITVEDLKEIGEIPHIKYLVNKTEHNPNSKHTNEFKPYKTTKSDVHNPEKEMIRKKGKFWEVTAATPPPIKHGPVKTLSLQESLQLQRDYNKNLKEIEARHAAEKLQSRVSIKIGDLPQDMSKFGAYRDENSESDSDDTEVASEEEVIDEEPDKGGVTFTVMS